MIKDMMPYLYDVCHVLSSIIVFGICHHLTLSTTFKNTRNILQV